MDSTIRTLKAVDFYGQIAMAVLPVIFAPLFTNGEPILVDIAFAVGGWQLLSFLIHLTRLRKPWIAKSRRTYGIWILAIIAGGAIATFTNDLGILIFFLAMIPAGTGLAGFYFILSYNEWVDIRNPGIKEGDSWQPL